MMNDHMVEYSSLTSLTVLSCSESPLPSAPRQCPVPRGLRMHVYMYVVVCMYMLCMTVVRGGGMCMHVWYTCG